MELHAIPLIERRAVADDLFELALPAPGGAFGETWKVPGQYVRVFLPDQKPLFLAMATPPGADTLRFAVRAAGGAAAALCALEPGAEVQVSGAEGRGFPLERARGREVLIFANGTGIGPIAAALDTPGWRTGRTRLFYGVRSPERLLFAERFGAWAAAGVEVVPVVSQAPAGWSGERGYVQEVYARSPLADAAGGAAILCGVRGMAEAVTALLSGAGMPREQILTNF